jgi:hypothetical protein
MKIQIFGFLLLLFAGTTSAWMPQNCPTTDWQVIDGDGLFTFRLPAGFVKRDLKQAQGTRAAYDKGSTNLVFIWGHSESLPYKERQQNWMNNYGESTTRIRGKRANIRTYWQTIDGRRLYRAELNVGNWQNGEIELYMRIEGTDPSVIDLAKAVFASVIFPLATPEQSRDYREVGVQGNFLVASHLVGPGDNVRSASPNS